MRFKRIDEETVRCLISESELNENGLELEDFLNNKGKTEDFLKKIISMAQQEVDYKVQGGPISVQVAVLENHTLALTLSEKQEQNIVDMLKNLRSAVEVLAGVTKEGAEALERSTNKFEQAFLNRDETKDALEKRLDRDVYELEFTSLQDFMQYCDSIYIDFPVENSLYKLNSNECYYLLLTKEPMTNNQLCKLLGASLEFTRGIYSDGRMKAYLLEHGTCILPEEALQHMKELDMYKDTKNSN